MKTAYIFTGLVLVLSAVAIFLVAKPNLSQPLGAVPGSDFINPVNFQGRVTTSGQFATTSQGTTITVSAGEFRNWANSAMVSFTPGLVAASTLTFPASSSVPDLVPRAGDRIKFCFRNATTTANVVTTLAGSTGINLLVASSSATALGSKAFITGKVGCIDLIREPATATTFDIDALLTVFN